MSDLKILFADDQIPDETMADDQITKVLKKQNPKWPSGFIEGFVDMRNAVKALKGAGFDVTIASTYEEVIKLIEATYFGIAIVDLGWFGDEAVPSGDQEFKGWDICREIDAAAKKHHKQETQQIIYSDRFLKKVSISVRAAEEGRLLVFKNYEYPDVGHASLVAAVDFIARMT